MRPNHAEQVCRLLVATDGIDEVIASEVLGAGRQADAEQGLQIDHLPRVLIEAWADDTVSGETLDAVIGICRSGRRGDGKIMLQPVTTIG